MLFKARRTILLLSSVLFFFGHSESQEVYDVDSYKLPVIAKTRVLERPVRTSKTFPKDHVEKWSSLFFHESTSDYIRLHFYVRNAPTVSTWELRILTTTGTLVQSLTQKSFEHCGNGCLEGWTDFIKGNGCRLVLTDKGIPDGLVIELDRYNFEQRDPGSQSLIPPRTDLRDLGLAFPKESQYRIYGRAIARITFKRRDDEIPCSGLFITTKLFVTNRHCINDPSQLRTARIWVNYTTNETETQLRAVRIITSDTELDFSILELENPVSRDAVAKFNLDPIRKGNLIIIQHPQGDRKKITIKDCKIKEETEPTRPTDFSHLCDTDGGSSGSPVMTHDGLVIGLHHYGMNGPSPRNLAVKFSEIVKKLRASCPGLYNALSLENLSLKLAE